MLRDDVLARLVENSDRLANNKALLRRIVEQHNFTQFENMEKIKGKKKLNGENNNVYIRKRVIEKI